MTIACTALLVGPGPVSAEDGAKGVGHNITAITDPPLDLFKEAKVTRPEVSLEPSQVTLPIPILEIAGNRMMRVEVNGVSGWVMPTFVETDLPKAKVEFICDSAASNVQIGATRGLGTGC